MTVSLDRPTRPASVVAPDPAVRWLAVLALALGGFGIGTTEFVAMGLLPDIAASFDITEPTAGHVISAYALGVVIGAPLIATLAARVPRKALLLTLMAVFTLGNLASVVAPSYQTLMAARFVAGLPHGAYFGVAALVATHLMGRHNRAKAVAHVMCASPFPIWFGSPFDSGWGKPWACPGSLGFLVAVVTTTKFRLSFWLP